jgi:cyclopropane fatty-acyl-phospholipid synthase-like methyltransferase
VKPYAESCEQNRDPILALLSQLFRNSSAVLEIGSGTGQHAVYFAAKLTHLVWYPSDRAEHHAGICMWLSESGLTNVAEPQLLDVCQSHWPELEVDAVFSANTAHIMHKHQVEAMVRGVGRILPAGGVFALYGAFNYQNRYTSESNERFDQWLKARDPESGIKDFELLNRLAEQAGMTLSQDFAMPANNRLLVWHKE